MGHFQQLCKRLPEGTSRDTKMMAVRETAIEDLYNSLVRLTKFCIIVMGTNTYSFMFTMCGKCGGGTIIYSMGLV